MKTTVNAKIWIFDKRRQENKRMRVAILCEYSGVVRDAFTKQGHYAISCDILQTESGEPETKLYVEIVKT